MDNCLSVPSPDVFAEWVRDALSRLYDSEHLQRHPLARLFFGCGTKTVQPSQALRRKLLEAIAAARPPAGVPIQSPDWRGYRILELRYLEGLSPAEAMRQLALGRSQFFREQSRAVNSLVAYLWAPLEGADSSTAENEGASQTTREQLALEEVRRLREGAIPELVDLNEVVLDLEAVLDPLAAARGIHLRFDLADQPVIIHTDRIVVRQICLNVMTYALSSIPNGQVEVEVRNRQSENSIRVSAWPLTGAHVPSGQPENRLGVGLSVSEQLLQATQGTLQVMSDFRDHWEARIVWSAMSTRILLVVDDNEDYASLFHRYLVAHHWRVIGAPTAAEARRVLTQTKPTVIVLDVMMPKEDGWGFLLNLKSDAATRDVPVIVCSVLNEPTLARALGAAAYLTKPVTQHSLFDALAPWL
jgi:CheY-like chemotaxis protein